MNLVTIIWSCIASVCLTLARENLFWATVYNLVAVPLAVFGILHPIVAAGGIAASSTFVVLNSLRIRRVAPRHPR